MSNLDKVTAIQGVRDHITSDNKFHMIIKAAESYHTMLAIADGLLDGDITDAAGQLSAWSV